MKPKFVQLWSWCKVQMPEGIKAMRNAQYMRLNVKHVIE